MSEDDAARALVEFLTDVGDAPEVIWAASIAMLRRATSEAEEARFGRFRFYPEGQLRRLREDIARGLKLARLASAMQVAESARGAELDQELHDQAVEAARSRRRAQTLPAQLARLEKQRRVKAGLPTSNIVSSPEWQEAARLAHLRGEPPPAVP